MKKKVNAPPQKLGSPETRLNAVAMAVDTFGFSHTSGFDRQSFERAQRRGSALASAHNALDALYDPSNALLEMLSGLFDGHRQPLLDAADLWAAIWEQLYREEFGEEPG